jgi:hypothetical protein
MGPSDRPQAPLRDLYGAAVPDHKWRRRISETGGIRWNCRTSLSLLVKVPGQDRLSGRPGQYVQFEVGALAKTAAAVTILRQKHQAGLPISSAFNNNNRNPVKNNPIKRQSGRRAVALCHRPGFMASHFWFEPRSTGEMTSGHNPRNHESCPHAPGTPRYHAGGGGKVDIHGRLSRSRLSRRSRRQSATPPPSQSEGRSPQQS